MILGMQSEGMSGVLLTVGLRRVITAVMATREEVVEQRESTENAYQVRINVIAAAARLKQFTKRPVYVALMVIDHNTQCYILL